MSSLLKYATLAMLATWSAAALAVDGVVSSPNCNESGFVSVLNDVNASGGGTITFSCGSSPVTITFTSYKVVNGSDVIDGGNRIVFDGGGTSAFFQVFSDKSLTLKNLTLQHGAYNAVHALENFGSLTLDHVNIANNVSTDAAIDNYGAMSVTSSTFSGNGTTSAGTKQQGGALRNDGGAVQINGSTFSGNVVNGASAGGEGGAIANASGDLSIESTTFTGNKAFDGGALQVASGTASIKKSTFTTNTGGYGAAIENDGGGVFVSLTTFTSNTASAGDGGAIWNLFGDATVDSSQFTGNHANTTGGAINCYNDALTLTNSAFSANQATTTGGALHSECAMTATNNTFYANTALGMGGGAIYQFSHANAEVSYATIVGNTSSFGAGIYNDDQNGGTLTISKSIISANSGGNCDGTITSGGYNLANDMGCGGAFTSTDRPNATLPLGAYANNGGTTSTMLPKSGNQAIDFVPIAQCANDRDQRNAARPAGSGCDSGAVEVNGVFDGIFASSFEF